MDYTLNSEPGADGRRNVVATTEFGELTGTVLTEPEAENADGPMSMVLHGAGAVYLLTVLDGAARMAVHLDGPTAVNYLGNCEARG